MPAAQETLACHRCRKSLRVGYRVRVDHKLPTQRRLSIQRKRNKWCSKKWKFRKSRKSRVVRVADKVHWHWMRINTSKGKELCNEILQPKIRAKFHRGKCSCYMVTSNWPPGRGRMERQEEKIFDLPHSHFQVWRKLWVSWVTRFHGVLVDFRTVVQNRLPGKDSNRTTWLQPRTPMAHRSHTSPSQWWLANQYQKVLERLNAEAWGFRVDYRCQVVATQVYQTQ